VRGEDGLEVKKECDKLLNFRKQEKSGGRGFLGRNHRVEECSVESARGESRWVFLVGVIGREEVAREKLKAEHF